MKILSKSKPTEDKSIEYCFQTEDGHFIETIYFTCHENLNVFCLSTQIGCKMRCQFCGTGHQKFMRNQTQQEIVEQVTYLVREENISSADKIRLASIGKPLDNYEASLNALTYFKETYRNLRLSLPTVGIKTGIQRLINEKRDFGLCLSLHTASDDVREQIMPMAKSNQIGELPPLVEEYANINKPGLVRISYLLLTGKTDTESQIKQLVNLLKGKRISLQLRPWNQVIGIQIERIELKKQKNGLPA